jgi:hypothetical protein
LEPAAERSKTDYRIVCVVRRADGNVRGVCYSERGSGVMYDDIWTIEEARHAIQQGHRLYTVSPSTGVEVELELHGEGIRIRPGEGVDLDDLPTCGSEGW